MTRLADLKGATIVETEVTSKGHVLLKLDDDRIVSFEGGGYDGLWTDVCVQVDGQFVDEPTDAENDAAAAGAVVPDPDRDPTQTEDGKS